MQDGVDTRFGWVLFIFTMIIAQRQGKALVNKF